MIRTIGYGEVWGQDLCTQAYQSDFNHAVRRTSQDVYEKVHSSIKVEWLNQWIQVH